MMFRSRLLRCFVLLTVAAVTRLGTSSILAADDEDDEQVIPGVIARYSAQRNSLPFEFIRFDPLPTFLLAAGEAPDPRLQAQGWSVTWRGVLNVRTPGEYRLAARSSGALIIRIGDQSVIELERGDEKLATIESKPLDLNFGVHPIEVRFTQQGTGARLKLFWQSDSFPREPLPVQSVGHTLKQQERDPDRFLSGRLLVEEHSCTSCHRPSDAAPLSHSLATRPGPKLTDSGARLNAAWVFHWLDNPQSFRPEAVMPRLFSSDRRGAVERFAVARFLASRGKPGAERKLNEGQMKNWPREGQSLFESVGCIVCHEKQGETPPRATLAGLGRKLTVQDLATFLKNPSAVDPAGRMPGFLFASPDDPYRLALYLTGRDSADKPPLQLPAPPSADEVREALRGQNVPATELSKLIRQPIEEQWTALGRFVMQQKRCTACHELEVKGEVEFWKPVPAVHDFAAICRQPSGGCLDREQNTPGGVPVFGAALDQAAAGTKPGEAIREFLSQTANAPGTPAPAETARLTLERLNCTGCHQRNGAGGLPAALVARLLTNQSEQNAEAVSPPTLTGVVEKLLASSIQNVLEGTERSRPWMGLQMPRFDRSLVAHLPAALAAADGEPLRTEPFRPPADLELIEAGRTLIGEQGFSCMKCHDMLGIPSQGTRGPELANVAQRVTYDWYERWMTDPQRLQPGTRMPTVFFGGKSAYAHILDGSPEKQRRAMWQYLLVCRSLPFPAGLRPSQKLKFPDADRVQVVRTFLPETSARGIALRSPDGIHLAFDAQACRLSYAWSGEFLDMRPVWDGRGGRVAGIEGSIFWTAPPGFPWEVTSSAADTPDFSNRGSDTSLGAVFPQDGKLYPTRLNFRKLQPGRERTGIAYDLDLGDNRAAAFTETVATFRQDLAIGVQRSIAVTTPPGQFVWLHAALADQAPAWESPGGKRGSLDGPAQPAPGNAVIRLIHGSHRYVLHQRGDASDSDWLAIKHGDQWSVMLRTSTIGEPAHARLNLVILKPIDDQPPTQERVAQQELSR